MEELIPARLGRLFDGRPMTLGRFRLCESDSRLLRISFSCLPCLRSTNTSLFNIEVNLCCGTVLGYFLAVQFHF